MSATFTFNRPHGANMWLVWLLNLDSHTPLMSVCRVNSVCPLPLPSVGSYRLPDLTFAFPIPSVSLLAPRMKDRITTRGNSGRRSREIGMAWHKVGKKEEAIYLSWTVVKRQSGLSFGIRQTQSLASLFISFCMPDPGLNSAFPSLYLENGLNNSHDSSLLRGFISYFHKGSRM